MPFRNVWMLYIIFSFIFPYSVCKLISSNIYRIVNCWNNSIWIVQISPTESIAFSYEVVCPETWVKFRGSCYNFKSVMLEMSLEEARDHCRKKGIVISPLNSFTQDYCWRFFFFLGNFSDVLTVQDDEESRFFLKEMWHFYQGPQNLWLGIIYDTDSKICYWLYWCLL